MGARYAVYFVPSADAELHRLGTALLGRDLASGQARPRPAIAGLDPRESESLAAAPAHYGLHATIVAPFEAAADEPALLTALTKLAEAEPAFDLPPLELRFPDGEFLALTLTEPCPALDALEERWVRETAHLRRPPSPEDIARRGPLPARQAANLQQWGYHLVMEDFRFHITVTGPVEKTHQARVRAALAEYFRPVLGRSLRLGALTLVYQASREADFVARRTMKLLGDE